MYGSSGCNTNIKYNPGYISIDTIKKHYSNKTNLAHSVAGVKTHVRASPESNAYTMPFLAADANERVYRHCETPLKNKKQFTAVKIFAAIAAVTLLGGGAAYAARRGLLGQTADNSLNNNNLMRIKRDFDSPSVEEGWLTADFLRLGAKGHGTSFKKEAAIRAGMLAIEQRNSPSAKNSEPSGAARYFKGKQYLTLKKSIEDNITHLITDFNETIAQKKDWLNNGAPNPEQTLMIENRIATLNEGKALIVKLQAGVNQIFKSRHGGFNVKTRELTKLLEDFSKKYTVAVTENNDRTLDPQDVANVRQYIAETLTQLKTLRG